MEATLNQTTVGGKVWLESELARQQANGQRLGLMTPEAVSQVPLSKVHSQLPPLAVLEKQRTVVIKEQLSGAAYSTQARFTPPCLCWMLN
ncbi:hypothetical protein EYF80_019883 [Liparis tanakae]|uniref:Uncharacterized protein n=1 Tax=Liparis tanakae TaxID=230148 RepID=A0A4Z2HWV4_9TELE|nr:hypothetical protein EYF80_019883 [Liparis tanakae]